jgi:spermidine synthase
MTRQLSVGLIYLAFFLSGAAALVYQVVWVRSLILVFGGSHLAVTAVLSIFMAGLAVGGYLMGRVADRVARPLRVYGLLELGIAAAALIFMGLMRVYPSVYVALAQGREDSILYLSGVRVLFSLLALIVPTTLMGGTLPILSRFVARQLDELRCTLSFLYGLNTLGAVLGALLAGFVLLPTYSLSTTVLLAVAANVVIGLGSILLQESVPSSASPGDASGEVRGAIPAPDPSIPSGGQDPWKDAPTPLVLWGIGISGFCALGYEVLWTRILTIGVGASVYGFTVMLVAFLTGIALGSKAYGVTVRLLGVRDTGPARPIAWFGVVQVLIGLTAFLVTVFLRDIPAASIQLQELLLRTGIGSFGARAWSSFALAFLSMVVPAIFMGAAFPLAGEVQARSRRTVGRAVGEVLAFNTVGAILGAGVSGFGLIYLFGIERSLQMLTVINIGLGLLVLCSLRRRRWLTAVVTAGTLGAVAFLAVNQTAVRLWDMKYFAVFRNNQPEAFRTPAMVREAVENTDVLYYAEGIESIVSAIKVKGGEQSFITNGRIEASTHLQAQQCQLALGHLPMLLSRDPKRVLVVGLGSGMTLGATSIHPGVERITLAEIEPKVVGVARTFAAYNHQVLDNPKVRIVFNDGRNFLLTTAEKFDVITADPIHPWFRGAGYLYTTEYFGLAAEHLRPGGVIAQWLPIYELTPRDLQSVVRTFRQQFRYTLMWLTHYDAELVGSNDPIRIDEAALERRIAEPAVASDLKKVMMGSAADFLSYFLMGTDGMARFSQGGILNTDDNLYLEFSAPFSIATPAVMEANVNALAAYRESLLPYVVPATEGRALEAQRTRWALQREAGGIGDPALALFLGGKAGRPEFVRLLDEMDQRYPWYAPGQFLKHEYQEVLALAPRPLQRVSLSLVNEAGGQVVVDITAVLVPVSRSRAALMFVDHRARVVYGQVYVDGYDQGDSVQRVVREVLGTVQAAYQEEAEIAVAQHRGLPAAGETLRKVRDSIGSRLRGVGARG